MRLIGRNPEQCPSNGMLGKLAFKDKLNLSDIDDIDDNTLPAIDSIVNTNTVVASFIYDTSNDTNPNWINESRHTSWYNETLNTTTRGATRDFPAVALIVAESGTVTIYDATDSSCPMWMVFNNTDVADIGGGGIIYATYAYTVTDVKMANGILYIANVGVAEVNFNTEKSIGYSIAGINLRESFYNIDERDTAPYWVTSTASYIPIIENIDINALAVTTIDGENCVYVGSNGGLDRIYKGSVSSWTDDGNAISYVNHIATIGDFIYFGTDGPSFPGERFINVQPVNVPLVDGRYIVNDYYTGESTAGAWGSDKTPIQYGGTDSLIQDISQNAIATNRSLTLIRPNPSSWGHGLLCTITDTFTSGWQYSDIRGAFLGSNVAETLSGTELVTNGTFDTGNLTGWTDSAGRWSVVANEAVMAVSSAFEELRSDTFTTIVGKTYTLTFDCTANNGIGAKSVIYSSSSLGNNTFYSTGTYSYTFVAESTSSSIGFSRHVDGASITIDNISIKEATPDLSYNNNALSVAGSVDFAPVATGSELCAVSGFSAANYLYQPYNSDLDFGTGDFYIELWSNEDSTAWKYLLQRNSVVSAATFFIINHSTGVFAFIINGNIVLSTVYSDGNWHKINAVKKAGMMYLYIDGVLSGTPIVNTDNLDNTSAILTVGAKTNPAGDETTKAIALLRIGAGAPSAEQIKFTYEQEKHLFQENAQWSLPALDVKAVDYDESNGLLTAGTASGYVRKSGLINVDSGTGDASVISTESGILSQGNN